MIKIMIFMFSAASMAHVPTTWVISNLTRAPIGLSCKSEQRSGSWTLHARRAEQIHWLVDEISPTELEAANWNCSFAFGEQHEHFNFATSVGQNIQLTFGHGIAEPGKAVCSVQHL